jgi:Rac GTPase-activating protein 1
MIGLFHLRIESHVKELKERILKSRTGLFDLSHYQDIHLICGVVKDFLRSLSEPLLTNALWKSFATVIDEESDLIKQEKIDALLQQLPKPNRDTLAFVILHLQRVAVAPLCRMPILNLSRTMVTNLEQRLSEQTEISRVARVLQ